MADDERASRPQPRYRVRPVVTPVAPAASAPAGARAAGAAGAEGATGSRGAPADARPDDPFLRDEAEDDDGYDPFSDRPPAPEPTFQEDPWR